MDMELTNHPWYQKETDVFFSIAGLYSFDIRIVDTGAYSNTFYESFDLDLSDEGEVVSVYEMGELELDQKIHSDWSSLTYPTSYLDPVLIFGAPSFNDSDPVTLRVRNVGIGKSELQLDEWDYQDGVHLSETVPYILSEKGNHVVDGLRIEAGIIDNVRTDWKYNKFKEGFFTETPIVFCQVVTDNESSAVSPRVRYVKSGSFSVCLKEQQSGADKAQSKSGSKLHKPERLHYIAIQKIDSNDGSMELGIIEKVRENGTSYSFAKSHKQPLCIAQSQTSNGADTYGVRILSLENEIIHVQIQEEQFHDAELKHADEQVGFIVVGE